MLDKEQLLGLAMSYLKLELQNTLTLKGYGTAQSSSLIRSIEPEIKLVSGAIVGEMWMNDYYIFVEEGVTADRVPYSPGRGRGGTSKYIQGLIRFFLTKVRLGFKDAKRASFATANKHKAEGIPLRSSNKFSRDGSRLNFIKQTLDKTLPEVEALIIRDAGTEIELTFSAMLRSLGDKFFTVTA